MEKGLKHHGCLAPFCSSEKRAGDAATTLGGSAEPAGLAGAALSGLGNSLDAQPSAPRGFRPHDQLTD